MTGLPEHTSIQNDQSGLVVGNAIGCNGTLPADDGGNAGNMPAVGGTSEEPRTWRFSFHGTGGEYFKIWIVNLLLTIVTLSFYSPWAKVRRLRYFYGNTMLGGDKFDFTAVPARILIGRIVAVVLFVLLSVVSNLDSVYSGIVPLLMYAVMPWLVHSTMRFRARNSKYGNSRFYFSATFGQSYWLNAKCTLVTLMSLGLLYPLALYWFKSYQINHLHIGSLRFRLNTGAGGFFAAVLKPLLMLLLLFLTVGLIAVSGNVPAEVWVVLMGIIISGAYIAVLGYFVPLTQGYLFRAAWQDVNVGNSRISTDLNPFAYAWIKFSNYIAVILTAGLLHPWAAVRLHRYQIQSVYVELRDNPQDLANLLQNNPHTLGEEIADVFDIDISL